MKQLHSLIIFLLAVLLFSCEKPADAYVPPAPPSDQEDPVKPTDEPTGPDTPVTPVVPAGDHIIVGYAVYWDTRMPDPSLLTHINYSFAHIKNDFESLDIKKENRLAAIAGLKKDHPGLHVLLSVGGWGAGNFSEMAASEEHRKNFCQNCLAAVKKYALDGIDLDWEYPTSSAAGISSSPQDTKNFSLLLRDLREALGEEKLLTMASSANAKYVDFHTAMQYLDFVNLMTYDMGKPPYHNAGLYPSSKTQRCCDESVALHNKAGVPIDKMVLGIPFFGHGNGGAYTTDTIDYCDIQWNDAYTQCWDDQAMVPYLADYTGTMVLSYDNETSIGLKADYVLQKGLLGAMYWNIEADDASWTLSKAIAARLLPQQSSGTPQEEAVLVTNPYVQKYLEEVHYPDRDYSYSLIKNYPGGGPGEADIPPVVTLTWTPDAAKGPLTLRLWDNEWSREYKLPAGTSEQAVTNLVPGRTYQLIVSYNSGELLTQGSFATKGLLHQVYFTNKVRNGRDLGGWKTTDGRTVRFRRLYRGGRVDKKYMDDAGRAEALAVGIRAELDLREAEDVPSSSYFGKDIRFCAPGFDGGYRGMLRDRAAGIKECIEFIADCLRDQCPVYFHCAAGRDRTGTIAMLLLGVLGVPEGEIGKDYELTYFSPADWSMYNGDYHHMRTAEGSYRAAIEYLYKVGATGDSFQKRVENYLLSIGVARKDIEDIQNLMLE